MMHETPKDSTEMPKEIQALINSVRANCQQYAYSMPLLKAEFKGATVSFSFKFRRSGFIPIPLDMTLSKFRLYSVSTIKPYTEPTQIIVELMYFPELEAK